jgi:hypothetical protein
MQVGVNLGRPGYMRDIAQATADINVQLVFCNAGYILKGFFYSRCREWCVMGEGGGGGL